MIKRHRRSLLLFLILCPVALALANFIFPLKSTPLYERKAYLTLSYPFVVPYLLFTPENYNPDRRYPLILALHAAKKGAPGAAIAATSFVQKDHQAFVLVPLAPFKRSWALPEAPGFKKPWLPALPLAKSILDQVKQNYAINENRIYAIGYSSGGFGVCGALIAYPETFAAAASVAGGWDSQEAGQIPPIPIRAYHSDDDPQIPSHYSKDLVTAINAYGGRAKYIKLSGLGHQSWRAAYGKKSFWDWLFKQHR